MRIRSTLLCLPLLVVGVLIGSDVTAGAKPPSSADKVGVAAAANHAGIDARLANAASISGTIKSAAGNKPVSAEADAYLNGHFVQSGFADATGHYTIGGLAAGKYAVCVDGLFTFGGGSTTGYLGRCLGNKYFNGSTVPTGATEVSLGAGQVVTGKNISLPSAAAISGKVTTKSGSGLSDVTVEARNRGTGAMFFGNSGAGGKYTIKGLTASAKGYSVCFDTRFLTQGTTGFLSRCYKNVAWGGGSVPSGTTKVSVSLGHTRGSVNQVAPVGGAISGKVTNAANGKPVGGVNIEVLSSSGKTLSFAVTNGQGGYKALGLAAATGDRVCALPSFVSASVRYKGKCWKNVSWNGGSLPTGTAPVSVKVGRTHGGVSLKLSKVTTQLGSIAGKITEQAGGTALQDAEVDVYSSGGNLVTITSTNSVGNYKATNLPANSSGYVVCAKANTGTSSSTTSIPATGWAPRCNVDAAWVGAGVPAGAKRWTIGGGHWTRTGVNVALHVGGSVSGTTFVGAGPSTADSIEVELFTAGGVALTTTSSASDGTYSFTGLTPRSGASGYVVCFDGRNTFDHPRGYRPQCYNQKAWNGS